MNPNFQWTVVGAGPAGIASIGQIIDSGVSPQNIAWIDPIFSVGDFGTAWKKVISNTPVELFIKVYNAFESFKFHEKHPTFMIERLKPESRCHLGLAAEPLLWITNQLTQKVKAIRDKAVRIDYIQEGLKVTTAQNIQLTTNKIVLAIGAEALTLPYPNLETIPFKIAADTTLLNQVVNDTDVIAVFGSYQSARSAAENLAKTRAKKVIHFYRSKRSFTQHVASLDLKENVESYQISPEILLQHIPRCNKAIYTVGFGRRHVSINGLPEDYAYTPDTGQIAPGIYGLGIAFPEIIPHMMGRLEYKVNALWPIIKHLKNIYPIWDNEPTPEKKTAIHRAVENAVA